MKKTVFNASGLQESQVLANFKVEELEKRYEMGWLDEVDVSVSPQLSYSGTWNGCSPPSQDYYLGLGITFTLP